MTSFREDVLAGLSLPQKSLSPKWLYDEKGSALFQEITDTPEYYPTRTEAAIFDQVLPWLADHLKAGGAIAEYGSGASMKSRRLLDAVTPDTFYPIDISESYLKEAARQLTELFPGIDVSPVVADFTQEIVLPPEWGRSEPRLGFFPGSTLGNFEPPQAESFLQRASRTLLPGASFLLGVDLVKDTDVLEAAYDDAAGITAAFNLNLLSRMNRELGTNFEDSQFSHRAIFNEDASRIEMHLVSRTSQTVTLDGQTFDFAEGETLHTENSYKFTPEGIARIADAGGWSVAEQWTDAKEWFGVFLLTN